MASLGNTSVSSLMRSASATASSLQNLNDKAAADQYEFSAKTQDDYNNYASYLQQQMAKVQNSTSIASQSKALTYHSTLLSTGASFRSAERSRMSAAIDEGQAGPNDKIALLASLYSQAVNDGDYANAQSIRLQYDGAVKEAQTAAQAASDRAASNYRTGVNDNIRGISTLMSAYERAFTTGQPVKNQDGSVVKGSIDPQTGMFKQDPNGKPLVFNSSNYDLARASLLAQKIMQYQQGIASGADPYGIMQNSMESLMNNEDTKKLLDLTDPANPQLSHLVQSELGGTAAQGVTFSDNGDGTYTRGEAKAPTSMYKLDSNGNPVAMHRDGLDGSGQFWEQHYDPLTGATGMVAFPTATSTQSQSIGKDKSGNSQNVTYHQAKDPLTGRVIWIQSSPDGTTQHLLADPKNPDINPFTQNGGAGGMQWKQDSNGNWTQVTTPLASDYAGGSDHSKGGVGQMVKAAEDFYAPAAKVAGNLLHLHDMGVHPGGGANPLASFPVIDQVHGWINSMLHPAPAPKLPVAPIPSQAAANLPKTLPGTPTFSSAAKPIIRPAGLLPTFAQSTAPVYAQPANQAQRNANVVNSVNNLTGINSGLKAAGIKI